VEGVRELRGSRSRKCGDNEICTPKAMLRAIGIWKYSFMSYLSCA
jgi:hypothetical protein